jgi:uncharacterized membrane protein YhaH (DUF805 family)
MSATISFWDHFKRLFDFRGRENRASFWPYGAVAFIITIPLTIIILVLMNHIMLASRHFTSQQPEQRTMTSRLGQHSVSLPGNHPHFMAPGSITLVICAVAVLFFAAAVVRRLHDGGKSGFWGLMPLPFMIYPSLQTPKLLALVGTAEFDELFFSMAISNLFYLVTLIWLIVLLAGPSKPAPEG